MEITPLAPADLPALAELCRRGLREPPPEPLLRRLFLAEPGFRPELHLALWDGPLMAGAILGGTRPAAGGLAGTIRLLVVDPALRRRGLGSRLLAELEGRLRAAGATELLAGGGPNYLWPGVDLRDTPALCLFLARGYTRAYDTVNMTVELAGRAWWGAADEARLAAAGWAVRRGEPADRQRVVDWVAGRWGDGWAFEAGWAFANQPASIFLAERGAALGGFACHSVSGLPGCFGPTATDEAVRGAGLGRALLLRSLADLREQGFQRVEIGWVGPIAFYARAADATISRVCWALSKPA